MAEEFSTATEIIPEMHVIKETITEDNLALIHSMRESIIASPYYADPAIQAIYAEDDYLMRFLRARGCDLHKATELVLEDVAWRATYRPQDLRAKDVEFQATTGKLRIARNLDRFGRPVILMHGTYDTKAMRKFEDQQIQHLVWTLEMATRMMTDPVAKYTVVINLEGFSLFNSPAKRVSMESAKCLSSRFPERLGTAILLNAPFYFSMFYTIVSPFVDARTKSKIKFIKGKLEPGTDADAQLKDLVGDNWAELIGIGQPQVDKQTAPGYDHQEFWARMTALEDKLFNPATGDAEADAAASTESASTATATVTDAVEGKEQEPPTYAQVAEMDAKKGQEEPEPAADAAAAVAVAVAEPSAAAAPAAAPLSPLAEASPLPSAP